jgi:hypothetical protein
MLPQRTIDGLLRIANRIATVAALLAGLFSFNTVYAPTQSPDALCTVLFTAAIVTFTHERRHRDRRLLALAGINFTSISKRAWPGNTMSRVPEAGDHAPYVYIVSMDHSVTVHR